MEQSIFERNDIRAKEIFEQATLEEFFGNYLFESREQDDYLFAPSEDGIGVWLNPNLEAMRVEETRKAQVIPQVCTFSHCEPIDRTLFEDKRFSDIEARVRDGGKLLAQKANKGYIDVLCAAVSDENTVQASGQKLDELLADVFSKQVIIGFPPDKILISATPSGKANPIRNYYRDKEIPNSHYVGQTISGQSAFWSESLPSGTILMFDSKNGIGLAKKPRFETIENLRAFTSGVCGYLRMNPVIKNTRGIVAITQVDQLLGKRTMSTQATQTPIQALYVELERINELSALPGSKFDLAKLIRLCEELNICYANGSYLAVTMLTRAVLDHIPPIFGYNTFVEVANNYGSKSLKKSLQNLQNSSRNISDAYLHLPIRSKESLPNKTQVDFSNDVDVLLAEIIRILK